MDRLSEIYLQTRTFSEINIFNGIVNRFYIVTLVGDKITFFNG